MRAIIPPMNAPDIRPLPFARQQRAPWREVLVILAVAGAGFFAGFSFATHASGGVQIGSGAPEGVDFSPVWKAWSVIDEKFVPASVATTSAADSDRRAESPEQKRVWGMIQGLANSLDDPYTFFLPPVENQEFADDMNGSFEGVGMEIAVRDQVITIVSPLKGTPAERAGLKSGDKVLKIDGLSTQGLDVSGAVRKIRGPKGTEVVFEIYRDGWSAPKEVRVVRDVINVPTVETESKGDVFIIRLSTFTSNSPDLFRGALREFVESGDTKLVLDLRGNPGGYLEAAVNMASWFLPSGKVLVTEDYAGHEDNIVHRSYGYDIFNENLKMVVLVDRGSASASEILAVALHHYGVARLVGSNTFGKGSVQELVEITPETALKLTVARWLSPDGTQIPKEGIAPDVNVEIRDEDIQAGKDPQLDRAIEILNQ